MRKFVTALVVIPLGIIFIVFAVANRHFVTVSFDPFNSVDPAVAVSLPLFVVIIAVAILGVVAGGMATWFRQRRWRRAARQHEADARRAQGRGGRSAGRRGGVPARPAAASGAAAARNLWGRRARQAGRDVVEPAPSARFNRICGSKTALRDHVPARQNLRPVHARDARRRARGRRRHGGFRVLSAVAAPSQPRDRARTRQAGQGPRRQGGADRSMPTTRRSKTSSRRCGRTSCNCTARKPSRGCATSRRSSDCRS